MSVTSADIRKEHELALAMLTPAQRQARGRLSRARQISAFNLRWPTENLGDIFDAEAESRSRLQAA